MDYRHAPTNSFEWYSFILVIRIMHQTKRREFINKDPKNYNYWEKRIAEFINIKSEDLLRWA